jgi:hypothetical protein
MLGLRLCITPFPFDFPLKKALLTILTIITLDQILKIWVKLNFH